LNRNSERIARSLPRGQRANPNETDILAVEDSLQLAAGSSIIGERMIAFEISINGKKESVAGIETKFGVLTAILSWAHRDVKQLSEAAREKIDSEELRFHVGGQSRRAKKYYENIIWINRQLEKGDEITIRIVETAKTDEPVSREKQDLAFEEQAKKGITRDLSESTRKMNDITIGRSRPLFKVCCQAAAFV
jgi:hypothetical protein